MQTPNSLSRVPHALALLLILSLSSIGNAKDSPNSPLADAVENQHTASTKHLLNSAADVNEPQADGMTALHWAAFHDQPQLTRTLIAAGSKVNVFTAYGISPLTIACQNGSEATVRLLLGHGADPNTTRDGAERVLATAARAGNAGTVKALLVADARIDQKDNHGQTALMWAAAAGNTEVVKVLLAHDADRTVTLPSGFTALTFAIRNGHIEVVKLLLADDTDVNQTMQAQPTSQGKRTAGLSPLMLAIENAHFELALMLLKAGANPNDDRSGFAPLHALSWVRKPEIGDNERGNPPPRGSGAITSLEFAKALVAHGADVNQPKRKNGGKRLRISVKGATPFLCAASTADVAYMKTLLALGADPTAKTAKKQNALLMAAGIDEGPNADGPGTAEEHLAAVTYLLGLDVHDIDELDSNNQSVMHAAAYKSLPTVIRLLDAKGANIEIWNCKNKQGRTPLDLARGNRPGNFKPDFETERAIIEVMRKHHVQIPNADAQTGTRPLDWDAKQKQPDT